MDKISCHRLSFPPSSATPKSIPMIRMLVTTIHKGAVNSRSIPGMLPKLEIGVHGTKSTLAVLQLSQLRENGATERNVKGKYNDKNRPTKNHDEYMQQEVPTLAAAESKVHDCQWHNRCKSGNSPIQRGTSPARPSRIELNSDLFHIWLSRGTCEIRLWPKFSDPAHTARGLQPQRNARVRMVRPGRHNRTSSSKSLRATGRIFSKCSAVSHATPMLSRAVRKRNSTNSCSERLPAKIR